MRSRSVTKYSRKSVTKSSTTCSEVSLSSDRGKGNQTFVVVPCGEPATTPAANGRDKQKRQASQPGQRQQLQLFNLSIEATQNSAPPERAARRGPPL